MPSVSFKIECCPRCGRKGSLHLKKVQSGHYYYVAHYDTFKRGIHWCYVPKTIAVSLLSNRNSDGETAEIIGKMDKPSVFHGKTIVQRGKSPCFLTVKTN